MTWPAKESGLKNPVRRASVGEKTEMLRGRTVHHAGFDAARASQMRKPRIVAQGEAASFEQTSAFEKRYFSRQGACPLAGPLFNLLGGFAIAGFSQNYNMPAFCKEITTHENKIPFGPLLIFPRGKWYERHDRPDETLRKYVFRQFLAMVGVYDQSDGRNFRTLLRGIFRSPYIS